MLEQMSDVPAQIVGARVVRVRAVEDVDQPPGGLGGVGDGGIAAVLGAQGMRPLAAGARGRRQGWMSAVTAGSSAIQAHW